MTAPCPPPSEPEARMSTVSVVTLAKGRPAHLRNVLLGLERQSQPPSSSSSR